MSQFFNLMSIIIFLILLVGRQKCARLPEIEKSSFRKNSVYFCNFDETNPCESVLFSNNTGIPNAFSIQQAQIIVTTTITDITSITKATGSAQGGPFDGPVCTIPWQQTSNVHYFCNPSFLCMPDQPVNNATKNCQRGRYLWGRTSTAGDVYFGELTIPPIDLGSAGFFEVSFHVVMFCDGSLCSDAGDSISVLINDEFDNPIKRFQIDGTTIVQRRWVKLSFTFYSYESIINIKVQFQRFNKITAAGYFVFDEIEIFWLSDEPITEMPLTSTIASEEVITISERETAWQEVTTSSALVEQPTEQKTVEALTSSTTGLESTSTTQTTTETTTRSTTQTTATQTTTQSTTSTTTTQTTTFDNQETSTERPTTNQQTTHSTTTTGAATSTNIQTTTVTTTRQITATPTTSSSAPVTSPSSNSQSTQPTSSSTTTTRPTTSIDEELSSSPVSSGSSSTSQQTQWDSTTSTTTTSSGGSSAATSQSSSTTTSNDDNEAESSSDDLTVIIVVSVVGGLALIGAVSAVGYYFFFKKPKQVVPENVPLS